MPEPVEVLVQPRAVRSDGSVPFVAPQPGVTPVAGTDLATKAAYEAADATLLAAAVASFQPKNQILSNFSSFLPSVADRIAYFVDTVGGLALATLTSYGRSLIACVDAAAGRAALAIVDATTSVKGLVQLAISSDTAAGKVVQADDTRLSDSRTPKAHKATHADGGSDAVTITLTSQVAGLLPFANGGTNASTAAAAHDGLEVKGSDIASAGTTNIATATGHFVHITGTTTITAFGTAAAGVLRVLRFAAALTLTHNATSLILPGAANITTAANDVAVVVSEGSGNWRCVSYVRAAAAPISGTNTGDQTITLTGDVTGSGTSSFATALATVSVAKGGTGQTTAGPGGDALSVKGADIASASTTNLATATGRFVHITGTTTITAFGTAAAGVERILRFAGSLTLTHNATSLNLPGAANIQTAANDVARFVSEGSGNWRCTAFQRASAAPDFHPYSSVLADFEGNVLGMGRPGLLTTDGGGLGQLVDASSAVDGDVPVVSSGATGYHEYKALSTLLDALFVPRQVWQENGDPVRTVGASSTAENTVVSATVGGVASATERWELLFWGDWLQNSGSTQTSRIRVKLGSTTIFDKAQTFSSTSGPRAFLGRITVVQRGATNKQRVTGEILLSQALSATSGVGDWGAFAASHGTQFSGDATETLTSAKTLSVTHQWDVSHANSYIRIYRAELIKHP